MEDHIGGFLRLPIAVPLTAWYKNNARKLLWRETKDPYRIWVSEIMLQQTRVEAVKPYYERFVSALPDVPALSGACADTLLKLWEGLGYYSRVRNMRKAAQIIMREHGGVFPRDPAALMRLPGIGIYTAGAVASIAYDICVPAVDANVLRVLARLSNCALDIGLPHVRRAAQEAALDMMRPVPPGLFNQALMELGACVCLPNGAPKCHACPLQTLCMGFMRDTWSLLPVKTKKAPRRVEKRTVFVLRVNGVHCVRKRPDSGLLASLWELPNVCGHLNESEMSAQLAVWGAKAAGGIACYTRKHIFTHLEWHMRVYALEAAMQAVPHGWETAAEHALPTAFRKCL